MLLFGTFLIALLSYIDNTTNEKAAPHNFDRFMGRTSVVLISATSLTALHGKSCSRGTSFFFFIIA
ncbi:putative holin-like toxin [Liquorilactobacillus nagelii]|uniref:putative holin-like toxin n=1 Tax=Liquorilactobacillus nagelii TaxID=82688 RepID=UPI001FD005E9|nr:putative holin-like toxin [Liquorilactobacillus nagelii]